MKRKMRRVLASVLAFIMVFSLVGSDVSAAGELGKIPMGGQETQIQQESEPAENAEDLEIAEVTEEEQETQNTSEEQDPDALEEGEEQETDAMEEEEVAQDMVTSEESKIQETLNAALETASTNKAPSQSGIGCYTGFEEGVIPEGWASSSNTAYAFEVVEETDGIIPLYGDYCAYLETDWMDEMNASLVLPTQDLTEYGGDVRLSFWYQNLAGEYGNGDRIGIYYREGDSVWQNVDVITSVTQDWMFYEVYLPGNYTADVTYGIIVTNKLGGGVAFDEVKLMIDGNVTVDLDNGYHNGSIYASHTIAQPEDQVDIAVDIYEEGCIIQNLCVTGTTTGEQVELIADNYLPNHYHFYMPYDNVVISGTIVKEYHLLDMNYENWEYGRAGYDTPYGFMNDSNVKTGDTLTIEVQPYDGCYATPISALGRYGDRIELTQLSSNSYSLTMPDEDVTISLEFLQKENTILSESFERESTYENWHFYDFDHDGYGWRMLYGGVGHTGLSAMCSNSYFESTGALNPCDWFFLPRFTVPENCMLSYWARESVGYAAGEKLQVYFGDDGVVDDMLLLDENILTSQYKKYVVDLREFAGQEIDIAFAHMDVSGKGVVEVDDIVLYTETVSEDEVLIYEMNLLNGHPSTWNYYQSSNFLATPEVDLTGAQKAFVSFYYKFMQSPNMGFGVYYRVGTGYWQIIYADIEGTEGWESRTIELPADALTDHVQIGFQLGSGISLSGVEVFKRSLIYTSLDDGFENGISPDWTRINGENGIEWLTSSGPTTYGSAHGGRLDAQVSLKGSVSEAWLITPKLQLDRLNYAVFSFWYYAESNLFSVYYRHGSGDWVQLFTPSVGTDQWRKKTFIFSGDMLQADTEIGFKVTDKNYGRGTIAIDDVKLESGAYPRPHLVQLANETMYGAKVVIDHEIAIPGEKVTVDVTPNSTFSEMLPFEVYGVFVTCGGQAIEVTEENAHRYSFSMPDGDVSVNVSIDQLNGTYFQDFSDPTTVNADWTFTDGSTLGYQGVAVIPSGEYAIMPAQIITNNHGLRFWIKETDSYHCTGSMAVYVGTTRDVRKMTKISPDYVATSTQTCYKLDLSAYSGQKVYIAFGHKNCNYGSLELDRVLLYHPTLGQSEPYVNDLGFEGGYPAFTFRDSANGYGWFIGTGDNDASTGSPQGTHNLVAKSVHVGDEAYMSGSFSVSSFTNVPKLSFWLINRAKGTNFDKLKIYYRVDNGAWQLAYQTTEANNEWTLQDVYFPKEAISWGFDLKFVATDDGGNGIGIDNIAVTDADPFLIVVDRSIEHGTVIANPTSSIAGEYVTLYVNAETGYRLESITATCGDQNISLQKSSNGTEYYFQMPAGKVNVTATFAEKVVCTELHEDFENGMPDGWHNETPGGYDWVIGTGDDLEQIGSHSGRSNAVVRSTGKMSGEYFVTPYLDLRGSEKALLHFWYLNRINNGNANMFYLCYRINNGSWIWYRSISIPTEVWTDQYILLPDDVLREDVELGFFVMDNAGYGVAIDDVTLIRSNDVYHEVGIAQVEGQGSVEPTQRYYMEGSTVDLIVTPFDVEYEVDTLTVTCLNEEVTLTKVDDCHYTFPMTADDADVKVTFKRKTDVRKVFTEDFESADSFAWTVTEATAAIPCWYLSGAAEDMGHSQNTALYSTAPTSANNVPYDHWAITTGISVPDGGKLSFWLREADYTNELVGIYVSEDSYMSDAQHLITIEPMAYYERFEVDLSAYAGKEVYVGFRHYSEGNELGAYKAVYLDDVCVYTQAPLPKLPAKMKYVKGAFESKLGIAFFLEIPEWLLNDPNATVRFTVAGKTTKKKLSKFTANGMQADGTYRLAFYVPAAQYRENIRLRIYDGQGKRAQIVGSSGTDYSTGVNYSLQKYAEGLKKSDETSVATLGRAMENYCTAAQIAFGYNSEGLTLSNEVTDAVISNIDDYKSYGSASFIPEITGKSLTVSFDSDNAIKVGYTFAEGYDLDDFEFYVDQVPATLNWSENLGYYLVAKNIPAAQLGLPHEFKVVYGDDVYVTNCSVLTYARVLVRGSDANQKNLGKALFLYYEAVADYFSGMQTPN